jgi:peptidoglycan/xylan/chitin deacetylase (PgdA/CDA1 family)
MNKNINFTVILILVVVIGIGAVIGVAAGNFLFNLKYPEATGDVNDMEESTSDSQTSDQTTSSTDKPVDETPKKMIALTFDDGPNLAYTNDILDLLEQYNAKATFFVCGSNLTVSTKATLKRTITLGCEIGNHTYSHKDMKTLSEEDLLAEIRNTNEKIAQYSGTDYKCTLYRPPYGNINRSAMDKLYDNGLRMYSIHWSSDSMDWDYQNQYKKGQISRDEAIRGTFDTIVRETTEGTVILMHDIHEITPDVLKLVLEKYTAEGYTFVTVSELFGFTENADKEAYYNRYRSTNSILPTAK